MSVIFCDVDTQHDFMRSDGLLYVPDSEAIIPALAALTGFAHRENIPIVASADDHDPAHRELSDAPDFLDTFPPHCMRGTPGQAKIPETALRDPLVIEPEPDGRLPEPHHARIVLRARQYGPHFTGGMDYAGRRAGVVADRKGLLQLDMITRA